MKFNEKVKQILIEGVTKMSFLQKLDDTQFLTILWSSDITELNYILDNYTKLWNDSKDTVKKASATFRSLYKRGADIAKSRIKFIKQVIKEKNKNKEYKVNPAFVDDDLSNQYKKIGA
jgi:hypothetical protein